MRMIFKEWRLECLRCHRLTKHLGWSHEGFPELCECGGLLAPELPNRRVDGVIPDDIPGGVVMEHVEPGRKVYSRTELKAVLAAKGYMVHEGGWAGPNDHFFTRGESVTREGLDKAKKMVEHM